MDELIDNADYNVKESLNKSRRDRVASQTVPDARRATKVVLDVRSQGAQHSSWSVWLQPEGTGLSGQPALSLVLQRVLPFAASRFVQSLPGNHRRDPRDLFRCSSKVA